jgi:hypothetical protein
MPIHTQLRQLIGEVVRRFVLRIYPPYAEGTLDAADVSFALEVTDGRWYLFCIDAEDNWSARVECVEVAEAKEWGEFESRIPQILSGELEPQYDYELYDASKAAEFAGIVNSKIVAIETLVCGRAPDVFGLRVIFEDDSILIYPNTDGSAIETKYFKQGRGLGEFHILGEVRTSRVT